MMDNGESISNCETQIEWLEGLIAAQKTKALDPEYAHSAEFSKEMSYLYHSWSGWQLQLAYARKRGNPIVRSIIDFFGGR